MRKKTRRKPQAKVSYTLLDLMMCSDEKPMHAHQLEHHLGLVKDGLKELESGANPTQRDWRMVADAISVVHSFVSLGLCQDADELIADAAMAMTHAAERPHYRLTLLEDYENIVPQVSHRAMLSAFRETELRIARHKNNKNKYHDITVVEV